MKISTHGLELIKRFEGLRLKAYEDAVGLLTIGYGHLIKPAENYQEIDQAKAEELLKQDVAVFENYINSVVKVPLKQNQFDALICLVFNIGNGNFGKSTLLQCLNQKDFAGVADEFLKWNKAGGKVLAGLSSRRQRERKLFLTSNAKEMV